MISVCQALYPEHPLSTSIPSIGSTSVSSAATWNSLAPRTGPKMAGPTMNSSFMPLLSRSEGFRIRTSLDLRLELTSGGKNS